MAVVRFPRCADLLDAPGVERDDAVRGQLYLVVRRKSCCRETAMQCTSSTRIWLRRPIEIGKRLVEQKHLRLPNDRTADHSRRWPPDNLGSAREELFDCEHAASTCVSISEAGVRDCFSAKAMFWNTLMCG